MFGERTSALPAVGYVPSIKRNGPVRIHEAKANLLAERLQQQRTQEVLTAGALRPAQAVAGAAEAAEAVAEQSVAMRTGAGQRPSRSPSQPPGPRTTLMAKWEPIAAAAQERAAQQARQEEQVQSKRELAHTEQTLKFGLFLIAMNYFRSMTVRAAVACPCARARALTCVRAWRADAEAGAALVARATRDLAAGGPARGRRDARTAADERGGGEPEDAARVRARCPLASSRAQREQAVSLSPSAMCSALRLAATKAAMGAMRRANREQREAETRRRKLQQETRRRQAEQAGATKVRALHSSVSARTLPLVTHARTSASAIAPSSKPSTVATWGGCAPGRWRRSGPRRRPGARGGGRRHSRCSVCGAGTWGGALRTRSGRSWQSLWRSCRRRSWARRRCGQSLHARALYWQRLTLCAPAELVLEVQHTGPLAPQRAERGAPHGAEFRGHALHRRGCGGAGLVPARAGRRAQASSRALRCAASCARCGGAGGQRQ